MKSCSHVQYKTNGEEAIAESFELPQPLSFLNYVPLLLTLDTFFVARLQFVELAPKIVVPQLQYYPHVSQI